jgi:hypothetical protein
MEKIKNKVTKYKYFWYYPKNKNNIILITKGDNKTETKKKLLSKMKNKEKNIVLITLKYKDKVTNLSPGHIIVSFTEYQINNNKITELKKGKSGAIYYDKEYLKEAGFKYKDLKNIIKKVFIDNRKVNPFGEFYADL